MTDVQAVLSDLLLELGDQALPEIKRWLELHPQPQEQMRHWLMTVGPWGQMDTDEDPEEEETKFYVRTAREHGVPIKLQHRHDLAHVWPRHVRRRSRREPPRVEEDYWCWAAGWQNVFQIPPMGRAPTRELAMQAADQYLMDLGFLLERP